MIVFIVSIKCEKTKILQHAKYTKKSLQLFFLFVAAFEDGDAAFHQDGEGDGDSQEIHTESGKLDQVTL